MTDTNVRTAPTPEMLDDLPLIQRRDGWIRCAKQTAWQTPVVGAAEFPAPAQLVA